MVVGFIQDITSPFTFAVAQLNSRIARRFQHRHCLLFRNQNLRDNKLFLISYKVFFIINHHNKVINHPPILWARTWYPPSVDQQGAEQTKANNQSKEIFS